MSGIILICLLASVVCRRPEYLCAIGRIPIYTMGILLFIRKDFLKTSLFIFGALCLIVLPLVMRGLLPSFYMVYSLAPFLIGIITVLGDLIAHVNWIKTHFEWLGKHTLEVYVTNIMICYAMLHVHSLSKGWLYYFLGFLLITPIVILCNNLVKKVFK